MIILSRNSAGPGFESLAAHKSPGHSVGLGFCMSVAHHKRTTFPDPRTELIRRHSPHLFPPRNHRSCSAPICS